MKVVLDQFVYDGSDDVSIITVALPEKIHGLPLPRVWRYDDEPIVFYDGDFGDRLMVTVVVVENTAEATLAKIDGNEYRFMRTAYQQRIAKGIKSAGSYGTMSGQRDEYMAALRIAIPYPERISIEHFTVKGVGRFESSDVISKFEITCIDVGDDSGDNVDPPDSIDAGDDSDDNIEESSDVSTPPGSFYPVTDTAEIEADDYEENDEVKE